VKRIDLSQTVGLVANIGVMIGMVLLVYELNQNRDMMQAQTRNSLNDGLTVMLTTLGSPEVIELVLKSENGEPLSEAEETHLRFMYDLRLRYYENVHYQYRNGLFEEEEFLAQREIWRRVLENRVYGEHWCAVRETFSPAFAVEIDGLVVSGLCD
jgi:hypothetical protein